MTETRKPPKNIILVVHSDEQMRGLFKTMTPENAQILVASPEDALNVYYANRGVIGAIIVNSGGVSFIEQNDPSVPVIGYSVKPEVKTMIEARRKDSDRFVASDGHQSIAVVVEEARKMMNFHEGFSKWTTGVAGERKGKWI